MSVLDFILAADTKQPDYLNDPNYWLIDAIGGRRTTSGERITPETAVNLSTYYAVIRCISEDLGKLPLILYRRNSDDNRERAKDHPLYNLLRHSPNPYMSAMSFRETMTASALGWGGGFAEIERDTMGRAAALHILHPRTVTVKVYPHGEPFYEIKQSDGSTRTLEAADVFHLHGLGGDGLTGWSLLKCAAEAIGLGLALQKFGAAFFGNGANIGGVLEHPKVLKKEAKEFLRDSWETMHSGAANSHKIAVLEEGMKWTKIGVPPEEAQFLLTRDLQTVELCRYARVPPHKVQHLANATYSNVESQSIEYIQDCLYSWAVRWEEETWRKLLPESERESYFCEHLFDALMRADSAARGAFYREMLNTGVMSPNDVRRRENMNPIGIEGDKHYIQGAMVPLDLAAKGPQKPEAQKPYVKVEPDEPNALAVNPYWVNQAAGTFSSGTTAHVADSAASHTVSFVAEENIYSADHVLKVAQRKVFMDAADRVVRKECMALVRMGKKHKSVGAFCEDVSKFHAEQAAYFIEAFSSLIVMQLSIERLNEAAQGFCRDMARMAESSFRSGTHYLEADAKRWETEMPPLIVNHILGEDHAS